MALIKVYLLLKLKNIYQKKIIYINIFFILQIITLIIEKFEVEKKYLKNDSFK